MNRLILPACIIFALAPSVFGQVVNADHIARYIGNGRYSFTLFIKTDDNTLKNIESVEYTLHPSYRPPTYTVRKLGNKRYPFALSNTGSGEFNVRIKFTYKPGITGPPALDYRLRLYGNRP